MTYKKSISKFFICCFLVLALMLFPIANSFIYADTTKLTTAILLSDYADGTTKDQEITSDVLTDFTTDFGDTSGSASLDGWTTPTYTDITFGGSVTAVDLTSTDTFSYGSNSIAYSTIGVDGITGNKYGLLFLTSTSGLAGIESGEFTIPAHAVYVLTFNVRIVDVSSSYGLNAKIIDTTGSEDIITSKSSIKTESTSYTTYSFLIRGNEFTSRTVKIQLLWGNVTESDDVYTAKNELGYAAVDSFNLFTVTTAQYDELATATTTSTAVDLYTTNPDYVYIPNGYFSYSDSNIIDTTNSTQINDIFPSDWTQETAVTDEANRVANCGIIDVNAAKFTTRMGELGLNLINPGNSNSTSTNNNVLLLYNETTTYQTITSSTITLAKNGYYEISFKFNTPSTSTENQTNSLSFYIVDTDGTKLYSSENMYSYTENTGANNEWTTFHCFIKTSTTEEKVNFVIKFGTETATQAGYAYIDEINLSIKTSTATMYENTLENTYVLKTEEGAETAYLATGTLSFAELVELDKTNSVNRSMSTYDYTSAAAEEEEEEEEDPTTDTTNLSYLWYVIPSILLAVCTIFGLIIFYARKIKEKIKLPTRNKKNAYDRKKTLEKQVLKREKDELKSKTNSKKQLETVRSQIKKLENDYSKVKNNGLALKEYVRKRENLQNRETKLLTQIEKENK